MVAVASVMAIAPMSAFADTEINQGSTNKTGGMVVSYLKSAVSPTYTITIPATVDLNTARTATIKAEGVYLNTDQHKQINVTLDEASNTTTADGTTFHAKNSKGDSTATYTINNGTKDIAVGDVVASFANNPDTTADPDVQTATLSFSEPTDATYAGTHTETLTFGISVEDATVTVTGVSLDKNTLELTAGGDTATLTATVLPENATDKTVTWSSDNEAVATVVDGVVTPIAKGTATITATAGGKSDTCTVTVKQLYSITFTGPYTGETLVMEFYEGDTWNDMAAKYPNTIKIYSGYAAFGSDGFIYESPYGSMVSATAQIDPNKTYEVE